MPRNRGIPFFLCALCAVGPIAIDMYLSSIPAMAMSLGATEGVIQFSLMTFFIGLMLGQLAYGPLSDNYGRKPLILIGLAIYTAGSIGCLFAKDPLWLHLMRLVQGLGASIGMVIAFAIAKDCYHGTDLKKAMALMLGVIGLSPVLAPLIGNMLQSLGSWRIIFGVLAAYGIVLSILAQALLPETRCPIARREYQLSRSFQHYLEIARDARFNRHAAAMVAAQTGFFAYLAGSATVMITHQGFTATEYSLLFGLNAIGLVFCSALNPIAHQMIGAPRTFRLAVFSAAFILTILAILEGLCQLSTMALALGFFCVIALYGFMMPTGSEIALEHQNEHAGTASALLGALQCAAGAMISALTGVLAHTAATGLVFMMLGSVLLSITIMLVWTQKAQAPGAF